MLHFPMVILNTLFLLHRALYNLSQGTLRIFLNLGCLCLNKKEISLNLADFFGKARVFSEYNQVQTVTRSPHTFTIKLETLPETYI